MHNQDSIGRELKILTNKMNRRADALIADELKQNTTEMQGRVIGFLHHNQHRDIFQKDVEAEFSITRATASKMLTLMEHNGLIVRSAVSGDARLKKLNLTERAQVYVQMIWRGMMDFEQLLTQGLTEEEKQTLLRLLRRMEQNVEAPDPCGR